MEKTQVNILFLGGAKKVSLAERFIEAGRKLGLDVQIFSYELNKEIPIGKIAKVIVGLKWHDTQIYDDLLKAITDHDIHILIPIVDPSVLIAAKLKKMNKNIFIPVSSYEVCKIFFDKVRAHNTLLNKRYNIPSNQTDNFPLIAKPRNGSASKGLIKLNNSKDWEWFVGNYEPDNYLIQKYINAIEYTVDCFVDSKFSGSIAIPRQRLEIVGGDVIKTRIDLDKEIISTSKKILYDFNLLGPVTIQFLKEKETSKCFIMEINPRFGGGVIASIEAGADICKMVLEDYYSGLVKYNINVKDRLLMVRSFRESFYYENDN